MSKLRVKKIAPEILDRFRQAALVRTVDRLADDLVSSRFGTATIYKPYSVLPKRPVSATVASAAASHYWQAWDALRRQYTLNFNRNEGRSALPHDFPGGTLGFAVFDPNAPVLDFSEIETFLQKTESEIRHAHPPVKLSVLVHPSTDIASWDDYAEMFDESNVQVSEITNWLVERLERRWQLAGLTVVDSGRIPATIIQKARALGVRVIERETVEWSVAMSPVEYVVVAELRMEILGTSCDVFRYADGRYRIVESYPPFVGFFADEPSPRFRNFFEPSATATHAIDEFLEFSKVVSKYDQRTNPFSVKELFEPARAAAKVVFAERMAQDDEMQWPRAEIKRRRPWWNLTR
jgi:hypothetical protein